MLVVSELVVFQDYKDLKDPKELSEMPEFKDLKDPPELAELKEKQDQLDLQEILTHASRLTLLLATQSPHHLEHLPLSLHGQSHPEN